jgi:peptidoglycan/LPS O-acetylase OafA/YrhL
VLAAFLTIFLLAWWGITPQFAPILTAGPGQWIANLLLVQDYVGVAPFLGVTWTLIIELVWYGLFAAMLLICRDRAGAFLAIAAPLAMLALAAASLASGIRIPLGRIGMIYAAIYGFQAYRHFTGQISDRRFWIDTAAFLGVMLIGNIVAFGWFTNPKITLAQAAGPWIAATLCFLLVYARRSIRNGDFVNHRLFARFGAISYSVYLFHTVAIAIARTHITGPADYVVAIILTFAIASLTYALVEKPGIRLGKIVARALSGPRPPRAARAGAQQ